MYKYQIISTSCRKPVSMVTCSNVLPATYKSRLFCSQLGENVQQLVLFFPDLSLLNSFCYSICIVFGRFFVCRIYKELQIIEENEFRFREQVNILT